MIIMKKTILLYGFFFASLHLMQAQDCATFRHEGEELMHKKEYPQALGRFWAAIIACDNGTTDIIELIKETQNRWVRDLETAVQREKKAYQEALTAKEVAEKARAAEEAVRKDLEVKERLAKERGQRAETLRISLLADIVREHGNKRDALLLSWLAMRLSGADIAPFTYSSFGKAVCDSFTQTIYTSPATLQQIQYFNDGQHIFVKNTDGSLAIVPSSGNGKTIAWKEKDHIGGIAASAAPWIATWRSDNKIQLWQADGTPGPALEGHTDAVKHVAFSHDGRYIVSTSRDNTARLWTIQGKLLATLTGHTGNVYDAEFSPDNRYLFTRSADGTIRLWNADGTISNHIKSESSYLYDAFWMQKGHTVVACAADGSVQLWSPEAHASFPLPTAASGIRKIAPLADGDLSILGKDAQMRILSEKGIQKAVLPGPVQGAASGATGQSLLSWTPEGSLSKWNTDGSLLYTLPATRAQILHADLHARKDYFVTDSRENNAQEAQCQLHDGKGSVIARWNLGTSNPLPNQFTYDGKGVLLVLHANKSLAYAPFPEDIYEKIEMTDQEWEHLIKTYNIELFDALVK